MNTSARILVVESGVTEGEDLRLLLERNGFRVWSAGNGSQALEIAARESPDLLLSDVAMPGMDGYQLCREIKRRETLRDVPVILLTSFSDAEDVLRGLEAGADDLLARPFDEDYLATRIRRLLHDRRIRGRDRAQPGIEIVFQGRKHLIEADRMRLLNLLLSASENAVQVNRRLNAAQQELARINLQLEQRVSERAMELAEEAARHRQAVEALRESELKLRTLFEEAPNQVMIVDEAGRFIGANQAALQFLERTLRKRLEAQLLQAQKMDVVGRLAGGVAHDFNNMLTVIRGFLDILDLEIPKEDRKSRFLGQIRKAADRAAALTQQLLMFSSRQAPTLEELDLRQVIEGIREMLRRALGDGIELEVGIDPGVGRIRANRNHIEQLLMNLAVNARDAMPQGGRFTVRAVDAEMRPEDRAGGSPLSAGRCVALSVGDTGSGMSREALEHIFEPFFTTKAKGEGTGLGLSIVYGIVKQCGGHIGCASEPGKGTVFTIHFPRAEAG